MQPYTGEYYDALREGARRSAQVVVPLLLEFLRPRSVIDVGCGLGTWLAVFREHGVEDVWGVDGEYVDRSRLEIPPERFLPHDLRQPLRLDQRFDLVVSLEVAEHLPAECAADFIRSLAWLGPAVLFSAAVPFQGGERHVNEQWPDYWARLFKEQDYVPVDCLRRRVWDNAEVEWWYAQNSLLYVARDYLVAQSRLRGEYEWAGPGVISLVHPKRYLEWVEWGMRQNEARWKDEPQAPGTE